MSLESVEARNESIGMSYGGYGTPPTSLEIALLDETGTELTGGGYARVTVPNDATTWPSPPSGGQIVSTPISFAASSGAWSDTATLWQIFDAVTGDAWDSGRLADPITVGGAGVVARPTLTPFYVDPDDDAGV